MLERLELLVGKLGISKLTNSHVVIIGLGGVGGYVLEALIRAGISKATIIDYDRIEESNLNRQIIALKSNIGNLKVDEFEKRIHAINEKVSVIKYDWFIDQENIDKIFENKIDYLIDACDTIKTKKLLIDKCLQNNVRFITCLGTGKRMNPSLLSIGDIRETNYDPIARVLRKHVKDNAIKEKITCCYSKEIPIKHEGNKIGSNSFVPASAGFLIASYVVNEIINKEK